MCFIFQITKLLLLVSSIFLLLNLPSHAIRVHNFFMELVHSDYRPLHSVILCQQFFTIIYNCNFAVNFVLYNLVGKNFRKALWTMLAKCYCIGKCLGCCSCSQGSPQSARHGRFHSFDSNTQRTTMLTCTEEQEPDQKIAMNSL